MDSLSEAKEGFFRKRAAARRQKLARVPDAK
jgi:hypothetical protein